ncbi:MAG TPA: hypothetical protein VK503_11350, partial [Candidatus Bathyarchaeia archaeon]|nr:hypothetical protein [Candidatus Bathyarchaeia archaeon]
DDSMALNTKQETCLKIHSADGKSLDTVVDIFANFWDSVDELEITASERMAEDAKLLRNEGAFNNALKSMIQNAQSELLIVIPRETPASMRDKIMDELGTRTNLPYTRLILYVDQDCLNKWGELLQKVDAYHSDVMRAMLFVIRDKQEALITLRLGSKNEVRFKHVWSNSRFYVEFMLEIQGDVLMKAISLDERRIDLTRERIGEECLSDFRSVLEHNGWAVQTPGHSNVGETNLEFALTAQTRDGRRLVAEFTQCDDGNQQQCLSTITSLYGRAINSELSTLCLLCMPSPTVEDAALAEYFGIRMIGAENREELSAKLSSIFGQNKQIELVHS